MNRVIPIIREMFMTLLDSVSDRLNDTKLAATREYRGLLDRRNNPTPTDAKRLQELLPVLGITLDDFRDHCEARDDVDRWREEWPTREQINKAYAEVEQVHADNEKKLREALHKVLDTLSFSDGTLDRVAEFFGGINVVPGLGSMCERNLNALTHRHSLNKRRETLRPKIERTVMEHPLAFTGDEIPASD